MRESNGQDSTSNLAKTIEPPFPPAVRQILRNDTLCIGEGILRGLKRNAVFDLIRSVFVRIPFESHIAHVKSCSGIE